MDLEKLHKIYDYWEIYITPETYIDAGKNISSPHK